MLQIKHLLVLSSTLLNCDFEIVQYLKGPRRLNSWITYQLIQAYHQYGMGFEIERYFFNKLGVLTDGDFKSGVLLHVFVHFLGGFV